MGRPKGLGKTPGSGRKPGQTNHDTARLREMILASLDAAGGVKYLTERAKDTPGPYMALVAKVLPRDINANIAGSITINFIDEFK